MFYLYWNNQHLVASLSCIVTGDKTIRHRHIGSASILGVLAQWNSVSWGVFVVECKDRPTPSQRNSPDMARVLCIHSPLRLYVTNVQQMCSLFYVTYLLSIYWHVPVLIIGQHACRGSHKSHISHMQYPSMPSFWNTSCGCNMSSKSMSGLQKSCASIYIYIYI